MAKPIIATNVSDLADILSGCGWLVEPARPDELAKAIRYVLDNPEESKENGQKARERCKARYSFDAVGKVLCGLFQKYE
jgi:glycosyltransferase involved in cell wall biosynthesis